jgi:type II secretory pathway pseudopilin PulG
MKSLRAITLLEVVIAVAVLGILMAVLFPAVGVGHDPEKSQAKNDVTQIATAVIAFESEYGRLPGTGPGAVGGKVLAALMGSNSTINPRGIVFIEVGAAHSGKSGISNGVFIDPWGGAYQIAYASGTNNRVVAGTNGIEVHKKVAVWNDPTLGKEEWSWNPPNKTRRYVTSWE